MSEKYQVPLTSLSLLSNRQGNDIQLINVGEEIPLTFKDFTSTYTWPSMGSLRKLAYESEINGLAEAFIKFKKRRLVLPLTLFKLLKGGKVK
jgi:hypothetical protein